MKVEDFWVNCGGEMGPDELTCPGCYHGIEMENGATIAGLMEVARKHIAEEHVEVLDGEVIEQPLAITR